MALGNVSPGLAVARHGYRRLGHRILASKRILRLAGRADIQNRIPREFGIAVSVAARRAPLGGSVAHIVGVGSEEQVTGAHAATVVASVANEQTGIDCAMGHLPRDAVRRDVAVAATTTSDLSVALGGDGARPLPARAQLWSMLRSRTTSVDLVPEPRLNRLSLCGVGAVRGAKPSLAAGVCGKHSPALLACYADHVGPPNQVRPGPRSCSSDAGASCYSHRVARAAVADQMRGALS